MAGRSLTRNIFGLVACCALFAIPVAVNVGAGIADGANLSMPGTSGEVQQRDDIVCTGAATAPETVESVDNLSSPVGDVTLPSITPPSSTEAIRSYEIAVQVLPNADALFVETINYNFGSTPKHGIYRDLVLTQKCDDKWNRVYPISDITVTSPTGAPAQFEKKTAAENVQLKIGSPDRTVRGLQTYVISYRLSGVLNPFADRVEFYWNVVGDQWQVPIFDVTAPVETPATPTRVACFAGPPKATTPCSGISPAADVTTFSQAALGRGDGFTVVQALPPGSVNATPRYYQEPWSLRRAFSLSAFVVGGTGISLVVLLGGVAVLGFAIGRDRRAAGSAVDVAFAPAGTVGTPVPLFSDDGSPVEFAPPDKLRPAQLAMLRNEGVVNSDVSATIVDLAVRGVLRIEELNEDYRMTLLKPDEPSLLEYERVLIRAIFPGGGTRKDLSELTDTFAPKLAEVKEAIYEDAVERGWFHERPDKVRLRWRLIGVALTLVTGAILAGAIVWTHVALLAVPPVIASLAILVFAGRFPRRTPVGHGLNLRVRGFERFIDDSEAPRARWAEQRNIFSEYLPYAMVLGQAKKWAKTFEPLGDQAMPPDSTWYVGHSPFSALVFVSATSHFASSAGTTFSSTPSTSSSGSSGFSGGGGGGFSGGGGGGGGGGSW